MYENQSWLPVASLFGLVGCPIPRDLKAEILLTLTAFAQSSEIASNMWITLEISQVLIKSAKPKTIFLLNLTLSGRPLEKDIVTINLFLSDSSHPFNFTYPLSPPPFSTLSP